ncbi:hypothetical protein SDRG_03985 [Saprolegnia diclina VS20]|uniref:Chitin-binding type-4 domain-containing protein n=1 Tax=Saprolegnia diclina (strain VS20) TaxID=1156394 RepID=T0S298_SAPDV|nr:hypothetical protein SDRG_03985 [Saprolegnia diclina VS20]EQC39033.1 hypothetical protein SDRG_03985 [Saprolegnia diclina VS20]|eukprot:XP_008607857.1 hypothetical protein SDRG_03985 [Saprolegnia diclina VS20]
MLTSTALLSLFAATATAHSWLECTDYDASTTANQEFWNPAACTGYARCGSRQKAQGFGVDTGLDFRPLLQHKSCQCAKESAGAYTETAPMATYAPGQKVCVAYPAKNHVAAACTNAYIPDTGVRIFRTTSANASDPALHEWPIEYQHLNGAHQEGVIDYKGFQHCPKFCDEKGGIRDQGRALCSLCFNLEKDIAPGVYSFQWQWNFNSVKDVYATCWEARVRA